MKTGYLCIFPAVLLLLAPSAAYAQDGYSSQPRGAMSTRRHADPYGHAKRSGGRRSLLDALTSWSPVSRPSSNDSWRSSEWSNMSEPAETSSSGGGFMSGLKMPWSSSTPERPNATGTRRVYKGATPPESRESSQPQRGWFASLFLPEEEPPPRPKTVNDFLGQPRP